MTRLHVTNDNVKNLPSLPPVVDKGRERFHKLGEKPWKVVRIASETYGKGPGQGSS